MKQGQFRACLRPVCGGTFTEVRLCGFVPTAIPARVLRRLAAALTLWSGWPVVVALSVAPDTAAWCESWVAALQDIPERHLDVRFRRRRVSATVAGQGRPDSTPGLPR